MKTIKNSKELAKLLNKDKDLILDESIRIEYQVKKGELRDVKCKNLFLMNEEQEFDFNGNDFIGEYFNGRYFNGRDFIGGDFDGWNFNGRDFNGKDFIGNDFNGWDFIGRNFNGGDFNGRDFIGNDFDGWDFNGRDFKGRDFKGRKVSYHAFFNCYGTMTCKSYQCRIKPKVEPVCLGGKIEIIQNH